MLHRPVEIAVKSSRSTSYQANGRFRVIPAAHQANPMGLRPKRILSDTHSRVIAVQSGGMFS